MGSSASAVLFSPDGTKIAAASGEGLLYIWDVKTGERTGLIHHASSVFCFDWSPDGSRIVSDSGNNVYIWDAETYAIIGEPWEVHTDADVVTDVAYAPNSKYIASSGWNSELMIWCIDGRRAREPLRGHTQVVNVLAFSPDSKVLASGSSDTTIRLWDVKSGDEMRCIQSTGWAGFLVYSHDGSFLAATSNKYAIDIWDAKTDEKHSSLAGHQSIVRGVSFSPDDKVIVSGSDDLTIRFWDMDSGLQRGQPHRGHQHWILSVAFSPDGSFVASSASDNTVRLWDAHVNALDDQVTKRHRSSSRRALDILGDGSRIVSGTEDGTIHIWDATTFTQLKTLEGHTNCINSLKYSRDGKYIFSSSDDHSIRVWNAESGTQLRHITSDTPRKVEALALSPDGKQLAFAACEDKIRVWSTETWEVIAEGILYHGQHIIYTLCYSRDGSLLAPGGADKLVNIWTADDMRLNGKPLEGHQGVIFAAVFSANADKLVSGDDDCTIRIWSVATREQLHHINWHTQWVTCIDLSPDGNRFVVGSADTNLSIWDLETGVCINTPHGHSSWISSVIYSSDGKSIISASDDSTIRVWDAEAPMQTKFVPELDLFLTHHSMHDGWIRNKNNDLVIWIPPEQRNGIRDVCRRCIPEDASGHPVLLD